MLSLLDYSAKKEDMLEAYYAQLSPHFETGEPREDAHTRAVLTNEVEVLLRDAIHLYGDLLRADELYHYEAVTAPAYPYAKVEEQLEALFVRLRVLLGNVLRLTGSLTQHGYQVSGKDAGERCLQDVELLLADESPVYTSAALQALLAQSLEDINAGRITEMTPEQL